jgi:HK97 family phage major capsid protein
MPASFWEISMSLQDSREKIVTNGGALLGADANFFNSISTRHQALTAKGEVHPADLRRLQNEVGVWLKTFVNRADWNEGRDKPAYEGAMAWVDLLQAEISNHAAVKAAFGESPSGKSGWIDAETGKPIHVLAPRDKLSHTAPRLSDLSVGKLVAGFVGGPQTPEIRAALSEGTDGAGGYSIPLEVLREFIDKLRAKTQFIQAGAQTIILNGMKTRIMRIAADPVPSWKAENAPIAESQPTFEPLDFVPKSLAVLVKVSLELMQDSVNVGDALEKALIGALSVALDQACLFGDGTGNSPLGLYNITNINTVDLGANGATPGNYDDLLDVLYSLEVANSDDPSAIIMHPRTSRTYRKMKDGQGRTQELPPALREIPWLNTTSVPINQTKGTSINCSTILAGDFDEAILGIRQELVIRRLDQRFMDNLQVGFIAFLRADVGFAHPESFTRMIGVRP